MLRRLAGAGLQEERHGTVQYFGKQDRISMPHLPQAVRPVHPSAEVRKLFYVRCSPFGDNLNSFLAVSLVLLSLYFIFWGCLLCAVCTFSMLCYLICCALTSSVLYLPFLCFVYISSAVFTLSGLCLDFLCDYNEISTASALTRRTIQRAEVYMSFPS